MLFYPDSSSVLLRSVVIYLFSNTFGQLAAHIRCDSQIDLVFQAQISITRSHKVSPVPAEDNQQFFSLWIYQFHWREPEGKRFHPQCRRNFPLLGFSSKEASLPRSRRNGLGHSRSLVCIRVITKAPAASNSLTVPAMPRCMKISPASDLNRLILLAANKLMILHTA